MSDFTVPNNNGSNPVSANGLFPSTPGYGFGGVLPGPMSGDKRDSYLNQATPLAQVLMQNAPQVPQQQPQVDLSPLQQILAGAQHAAANFLPYPVQMDQANTAASLAGAQARQNAMPQVPAYQPFTPGALPTPQFAPVPERQAPATPSPWITGLAALAGAIAPRYAGQMGAAPLQAAQGVADQNFQDAWRAYQAREAQADELNKYALLNAQTANAAGERNNEGANNHALMVYKAAVDAATNAGDTARLQALAAQFPTLNDNLIAAQNAGVDVGQAQGNIQTALQQQQQRMAAAQQDFENRFGLFRAQSGNLLDAAKMAQQAEEFRQGQAFQGGQTDKELATRKAMQQSQFAYEDTAQDKEQRSKVSLATLQFALKNGAKSGTDFGDVMDHVIKDPYVVAAQEHYKSLNDAFTKATTPEDVRDLGTKRDQQRVILDQAIQDAIQRYGGKAPGAAPAGRGLPGIPTTAPPAGPRPQYSYRNGQLVPYTGN